MDYAKDHKTVYLAKPKKDYHEIRLSTANIYGPFETQLTDERRLLLTKKTIVPIENEAEDEIIYSALADVKIPTSIKEPLLILVPTRSDDEMRYKALVIERNVGDFPFGSYKFINFSTRKIRGMIGKTFMEVAPKKMTNFDPLKKNKEDRLKVQFQYQKTGGWQTFGAATWANRGDRRTLLFAYLAPDTGRMKIRGIPIKVKPKIEPAKP